MIRQSSVSGKFYPNNVKQLLQSIEDSFNLRSGPGFIPELSRTNSRSIKSIMVPHAGYIYSGSIASNAYCELALDGFPETFIILGPNHTGLGKPLSLYLEGEWLTPLGRISVDSEFGKTLLENSKLIEEDYSAHFAEHSIEVQLPFLQYFSNDFKIVPIVMANQSKEAVSDIVDGIIKTSRLLNRSVCLIASTDLSHFNSLELANSLDEKVLDCISLMDEDKLLELVLDENISMCGYAPVMASILFSKLTGNGSCKLLKYGTSADVTGDSRSVVGYASSIFK